LNEVILHLGTNIGFRAINLELARIMLSNHIGALTATSSVYETAAWGVTDQADFLNQAVSCLTDLSPTLVLAEIHKIEDKMGRIRTNKWGPRIIDVDLIFYGDEIIENHNLKIPHPQLTNRSFVLRPLLDICPDKVHPANNQTVRQLAQKCADTSKVSYYSN